MSVSGISIDEGIVKESITVGSSTQTDINNTGISTPSIETEIIKQSSAIEVASSIEQRRVVWNSVSKEYEIVEGEAGAITSDQVLIVGKTGTTLTEYIAASDSLVYVKTIGATVIIDLSNFAGADIDLITCEVITSSGGGGGATFGAITTSSTSAADVLISDSADTPIVTIAGGSAGFSATDTTFTLDGLGLPTPVINQPGVILESSNPQTGVDGGRAAMASLAGANSRTLTGTEGGSGIGVFFEIDLNALVPADKIIKITVGDFGIGATTDDGDGADGNPGSVSIGIGRDIIVL